jgi:hypothetical protein
MAQPAAPHPTHLMLYAVLHAMYCDSWLTWLAAVRGISSASLLIISARFFTLPPERACSAS